VSSNDPACKGVLVQWLLAVAVENCGRWQQQLTVAGWLNWLTTCGKGDGVLVADLTSVVESKRMQEHGRKGDGGKGI
jgi:hypothetical protein